MNRRRRLLMSGLKVNVEELEFSYTGTWTDSLIEMSGATYRVLQLKSNGTLTIDPRMVGVVPFDVWCVREGEAGRHGYDSPMVGGGGRGMHAGCTQGGSNDIDALAHWYAADGRDGTNGGWNIITNVIAMLPSYSASVGKTAYLGSLISVSGTDRSGTAWFSLPASNNGQGGAGGEGGSYTECRFCGKGWTDDAGPGSPGTPGIVVIRIPLG